MIRIYMSVSIPLISSIIILMTSNSSVTTHNKLQFMLHTYHNRPNTYLFAVNPLRTQQDALITDEGRDVNLSWDAPWISVGHIDQTGWAVEISIPLTTLRFTEGATSWG